MAPKAFLFLLLAYINHLSFVRLRLNESPDRLIIPFSPACIDYRRGPDKSVSCTGLGDKIYFDVNSSGSCRSQTIPCPLRFCSCASDKAAFARRGISDSCGCNTVTIAPPDCSPAAVRTRKQSNVQPQRQSCSQNIRFQPIVNNAIKGPLCPSGQCHFLESTLTS